MQLVFSKGVTKAPMVSLKTSAMDDLLQREMAKCDLRTEPLKPVRVHTVNAWLTANAFQTF